MSTDIYKKNSLECSRVTTLNYSTSFSMGIRMLHRKYRDPIFAVYGYVRFADEIVDTFFGIPQQAVLNEFRQETFTAINRGFSANPILHSFQWVVNTYGIDTGLIDSFLNSMESDLHQSEYNRAGFQEYIYGSAEVVGLMCLRIFCEGDDSRYNDLLPAARKLGEAFQKVNFLRDIRSDYKERGRLYFPDLDLCHFSENHKNTFEREIADDFAAALEGIRELPRQSRFGVYLAYVYYQALLNRIRRTPARRLLKMRQRIPDRIKLWLLVKAWLLNTLNLL